jgi:hypothetical protein
VLTRVFAATHCDLAQRLRDFLDALTAFERELRSTQDQLERAQKVELAIDHVQEGMAALRRAAHD